MGIRLFREGRVRLERLLKMGLDEITVRGRQETSKWLERVATDGKKNGHSYALLRKIAPGSVLDGFDVRVREQDLSGAAETLLDHFQEISPGRFFEGPTRGLTAALLLELMPGARDQVIVAAEAICRGRFDLLGYRLFFGDPVDWHLDPNSGHRVPLMRWSRYDRLNPAGAGDSKVIWELNRHQWLVRLGQAYQLTGEERYAEKFAHYIRQWVRANPPGMGINWASSLEAALRLISWCWALHLFQRSAALSSQLFVDILEWIRAHAAHVEKYLSYYFAPNTHLTGEALGLFYAGVLFPELRPAGRWLELGTRILVEQSERQLYPDGVYFEQSTCYQRYTVEIYLHFLILAARSGLSVPGAIGEKVQKMLDFLLAVRSPDGSMPQIGDADGGSLLPLAPRAADDFRGVFSTAAVWFGRSEYAWAGGGLAPEALWLLGPAALKSFKSLLPAPPAKGPSRIFPDGGYIVMRGGWEIDAHHLLFDVGPLGCPVSSGHGHADLLSIQCSVFGEPHLVDPGTYCYTADSKWRDFLRSTASHSSLMVSGASQAVPAGPFGWEARPRARLRKWLSTESYDIADGEHDAYQRLRDPVTHRRQVIFVKPRYWILVDDLEGAAEHRVELRFQFAPIIDVALEPELWARSYGSQGHGLFIKPFTMAPFEGEVIRGELAPIQGWVSPNYGRREPAPQLIYSTVSRLPLRVVTLLLPVRDPFAPVPSVSMIIDNNFIPTGLIFKGRESVIFQKDKIVLENG